MCELLAMSAQRPADAGPYLDRLMPRGGLTGPHADGWGVAFYEGLAARIFKDPTPAAESPLLRMLTRQAFMTTAMIAHIRLANPSVFGRETGNTHPFEREWNGRSWVFAHNGKLPGIHDAMRPRGGRFKPVGGTDSELAFCCLLDAIARRVGRGPAASPQTVLATIEPVVKRLGSLGEFNFILGDGECLYVHAHTRLHVLERPYRDAAGAAKRTLFATAPLTDEPWQALAPGSLHVYRHGERLLHRGDRPPPVSRFPGNNAVIDLSRREIRTERSRALPRNTRLQHH
jgi:glutamine amidotransferase